MNTVGTASTCLCDNLSLACDSGWVRVPNCEIDRVPCGAAEREIGTCDRIEGGSDGATGSGGVGGSVGSGGVGGSAGMTSEGGPAFCVGMSCGVDRGVSCGNCVGGQYCADDYSCRFACAGKVCGDDHGYVCGSCGRDQVCSDQQEACLFKICPPNQIDCDINYRATCNALGTGFSTRLENCGTRALFCHQGACGTHAVEYVSREPLGEETITYSGSYIGNFYEVTVNRKLTELGARSLASPDDMNWVVLELGATPIELLNLPGTWNPDADLYSNSGPINVSLVAGKTYFIGVIDRSTYQFKVPLQPHDTEDVTFGRAIGAWSQYIPPTAPTTSGRLYSQRLTTDAP
jgi:hypothetical protein